MAFEWLAGTVRIAERILDALHDNDRQSLEPSVDCSYDSERKRFNFLVEIHNQLEHAIQIATIKLSNPNGGALRIDPRLMLFPGDPDDQERALGNAVTVMRVGQDAARGGTAYVKFVFVPPGGWRGGEFSAEIEVVIKRASEKRKSIRIRRDLVCTSDN